jgi:hypothetical protein
VEREREGGRRKLNIRGWEKERVVRERSERSEREI